MRFFASIAVMIAAAVLLTIVARAETDAGAPGAVLALESVNDAGPPPGGFPPDPAPLVTRHQWVIDLGYRAGAVTFNGSRRIEAAKAITTPRMMGRFAVELYVGKELIDRVRFDFPLLGADELGGGQRRFDAPPSFERKLSTIAAVMIPHSERATRVVLLDRATGRVWPLPWPFVARGGDAG